MDVMELLQGQLSEGMLDQLTQQIGGADKQQTAAAASGIISTLMGGLAKNASSTDGAAAISNALDRDHDGSILDDMMGMLSGNKQPTSEKTLNGSGIVNHILGEKKDGAVNMISKLSGLDSGSTGNLMNMLAPVVMGALGKKKQEHGLDVAGIASLLSGTVASQSTQNPTMDLVTRFLDADGDGSVLDDITSMGMKFLGGFFGRK
ncbi:MAG: DUF937 domain-containing protein [Saprospiraceae bacterium]|nr:DUF937 domain-containing protein [Saprospiraceae bacterium]